MKKLWEIDHPYYMNDGNYFSVDCHIEFEEWSDFFGEWGDADLDYNWFVRWDWLEGEDNGAEEYNGDDSYRNGLLKLQCIGQRKGLLQTFEIKICRAEEPLVKEFLTPYWNYMKSMWVPFANKEGE